MQAFLDRFAGVLRLDRGTFEGIKHDAATANGQALAIVLLTGLLSGIGTSIAIGQAVNQPVPDDPNAAAVAEMYANLAFLDSAGGRVAPIVFSVLLSVVVWPLFAALARWVGRTLFGAAPDAASQAQVRNLVGWGYAPGLLNVLLVVPVVGTLVSLVAGIWALVTQVVGIRTALGVSTGRAVGVWVVSWVAILAVFVCIAVAATLALVGIAG